MKLRNKKTGQEGNFIVNEDHFECVDLEYVPEYRSLAELNDEWEDYKPTEPLIKDEKIREIIRLWTKVNDVVELTYNDPENSLIDIFRNKISFNGWLGLDDGCFYTTKELCGEEE